MEILVIIPRDYLLILLVLKITYFFLHETSVPEFIPSESFTTNQIFRSLASLNTARCALVLRKQGYVVFEVTHFKVIKYIVDHGAALQKLQCVVFLRESRLWIG